MLDQMVGRADVVRITAGSSRGTGFLIDESRVLTALHVVGSASAGAVTMHGPVRVEGALVEAGQIRSVVALLNSVEGMPFDSMLDWICLRVEGLDALVRPRVRASRASDATEEWRTYGFPHDAPDTGKSAGGGFRSIDAVMRSAASSSRYSKSLFRNSVPVTIPADFLAGRCSSATRLSGCSSAPPSASAPARCTRYPSRRCLPVYSCRRVRARSRCAMPNSRCPRLRLWRRLLPTTSTGSPPTSLLGPRGLRLRRCGLTQRRTASVHEHRHTACRSDPAQGTTPAQVLDGDL